MGILLCSRTFFAIQGVLYPASIVTNLTSGKLFVTWSYAASHATPSLTFPAVTSTPNTKPCLSQAVCASYANCRSCAPFTGSVLDTVFSTVPPPELPLFSSSSSSLTFLPSCFRSSIPLCEVVPRTPSRPWRPVPSATSFIRGCFNMCSVDKNHAWVYHPVVQCFVQNMCKNFFTQLRGKAFAKGITYRCEMRDLVQ